MNSLCEETALKKLREARVARLSTIDGAGRPHIVPVCFACDASDLYTALDRKPKRFPPERLARVRNIRMNPNVALLVDEYLEDWSRLWYVLVRGRAAVMPAAPDQGRRGALDLLRVKYPQYAGGLLADDALVIRIHPEGITAWGKLS